MAEKPHAVNAPGASVDHEAGDDKTRVVITVCSGIAGALIFIAGAVLAIWSYAVQGFDFSDWKFWIGYGAMLSSIFAFAWLLTWNRDLGEVNPAIRRTLYGYNIFLATVFLGAILVLGNILVTQYGHLFGIKASYDWTSQGVFTLTDVSVQQAKALTKPVKIIALYQRGFRPAQQLEQLFRRYAAVNKEVTFEFVDLVEDRIRTEDIFKKYPDALLRASGGFLEPSLIITYGSDEQAPHKVVKDSDVFKVDTKEIDMMSGQRGGDRSFFGENAITSALRALVEDKKTAVYFTTGHGELDLSNSDERDPAGMGLLKQRLTDLNIKAEPINLIKSEVPADADVLAIAGPKSAFGSGEIQKIRDVMDRKDSENKRKARLLVMFESPKELGSGAALDAGLGELLVGYKVQVKNNLVYDFVSNYQRADQLIVPIDPEGTLHPIVAPLKNRWVLMVRAREIAPAADTPPMAPGQPSGGMQASNLLTTAGGPRSWAETDYENRPNPQKPGNTPGPVSLGVAVTESEGAPPHPMMPGAQPPPTKSTPVAVVLGDATFAANFLVVQKPENEDLFLNCINWLGGRIADIGIQPKVKKYQRLSLDKAGYFSIVFEPFFHLTAIAGFLAGLVWVVRAERFQLLWLPVSGTLVLLAIYTGLTLWLVGPFKDAGSRQTIMRVLLTCVVLWSTGLSFWLARVRLTRPAESA